MAVDGGFAGGADAFEDADGGGVVFFLILPCAQVVWEGAEGEWKGGGVHGDCVVGEHLGFLVFGEFGEVGFEDGADEEGDGAAFGACGGFEAGEKAGVDGDAEVEPAGGGGGFHLRFTIYDLRFTIYDLRFTIWKSGSPPARGTARL